MTNEKTFKDIIMEMLEKLNRKMLSDQEYERELNKIYYNVLKNLYHYDVPEDFMIKNVINENNQRSTVSANRPTENFFNYVIFMEDIIKLKFFVGYELIDKISKETKFVLFFRKAPFTNH